jgi:uncharacterized protein YndB with AHSA1/START domain
MWLIAAFIVAILLAGLIYLARQDGDFHVKRSLEIAAPRESVFATIVDFKSWPQWSPWLIHEPDADITYSENYPAEDGSYSWDGAVIGAGKLTHLKITPTSSIRQEIELLHPFKSISQVSWEFTNRDGNSLVSWEISGRMPFLFRFRARQLESMLGRDFELGLELLNGYLNANAPHPGFAFAGNEDLQNFSYWAIPCNGKLRQLETARKSGIATLRAAAAGSNALALTLYHQFDPLAAHFQAEIALPIGDHPPLSNYTRREFRGGRYYKMTLHGDHRFVPLGWYALSNHCRLHKIKLDQARPALEIYHQDPDELADSNRISSALYIPIK